MGNHLDSLYYARRARQSRTASRNAASKGARMIHDTMTVAYDRLARVEPTPLHAALVALWSWTRAAVAGSASAAAIGAKRPVVEEKTVAQFAPELVGLPVAAGTALVLRATESFRKNSSPERSVELDRRLSIASDAWDQDGQLVPYWSDLVVLRKYEAELAMSRA